MSARIGTLRSRSSSKLRALVQHPAQVSYTIEKETDFKTRPPKEVDIYLPIIGCGSYLRERIGDAQGFTYVIEGITPLHWAAEHGAVGRRGKRNIGNIVEGHQVREHAALVILARHPLARPPASSRLRLVFFAFVLPEM